jgi:hypothetical protein
VGLRNCRAAWRHMTVRLAIGKVYEDLANSGNAQSEAAITEAGVRIKAVGPPFCVRALTNRKPDPFPLGSPPFTLGKLYRRKLCQMASQFFPLT